MTYKNRLTTSTTLSEDGAQVLETPSTSGNRSRQTSGIFTTIGFSMAGSAQRYNTLRGKVASGLVAVSKCPPPLHNGVTFENLLGGHHGY
ncbi:MAG: hypothetical protein RIR18_1279 [Pseudomonadota bacterium]|jgi:hypothetical protein